MKIKKLLLASTLCLSTFGFSQVDFSSTRYGLILGGVNSRVQNAHNPSSSRISFYGSAFALVPVGSDDMFYIQPQVEYLSAGENGGSNTTYASNYLSIPVYFKAYFSEAESEFFAQLGPRFGFLLNQNIKNAPLISYNGQNLPIYEPGYFGKAAGFDFAISAGLGFSYKRKWEFTGRFDFGVSNNLPDLVGKEPKDGASNLTKRQHVLSAGISYIFD